MIVVLILLIFLLILQLFTYFLLKNDKFCDNFEHLNILVSTPTKKYFYQNLNKSSLSSKIKKILKSKHKKLYFEEDFFKSKEYLLTLSTFIDYKINNCKIKFRTKDDIIIIENIAYLIAKQVHHNNPYNLFKDYKKVSAQFSIKLKENKIFKILLAQKLIDELLFVERELKNISTVIQICKKRNFFFKYRKNILNNAKYYSVFKYNPNSTKYIIAKNLNKKIIISEFLSELYTARKTQRIILTYLKTMF